MLIIGDVHGRISEYNDIIKDQESSFQVGDMAFKYSDILCNNPCKHVFIGGNHDNWDIINNCPNYLGRFGIYRDIFFVGGAKSIDTWSRIEGVSWWPQEELGYIECNQCIRKYAVTRPKIVISHDCPSSVRRSVFGIKNDSQTSNLLENMLEIWKPELWIYGHHHKSTRNQINNTYFIGLGILEQYQLQETSNTTHNF